LVSNSLRLSPWRIGPVQLRAEASRTRCAVGAHAERSGSWLTVVFRPHQQVVDTTGERDVG
jgi:hypothetical protein